MGCLLWACRIIGIPMTYQSTKKCLTNYNSFQKLHVCSVRGQQFNMTNLVLWRWPTILLLNLKSPKTYFNLTSPHLTSGTIPSSNIKNYLSLSITSRLDIGLVPEWVCRVPRSIFKFSLAVVFLSKILSLILSKKLPYRPRLVIFKVGNFRIPHKREGKNNN